MPPRMPKAEKKPKPLKTACFTCGAPSDGMFECELCFEAGRPFSAASEPEPIRADRRRAGRGPVRD